MARVATEGNEMVTKAVERLMLINTVLKVPSLWAAKGVHWLRDFSFQCVHYYLCKQSFSLDISDK